MSMASMLPCDHSHGSLDRFDQFENYSEKHNDSSELSCEVCSKIFINRAKLDSHLRVHGRGQPTKMDKQFLCDVCSKTFASRTGLGFHLRTHTGYKPYTCQYCNKGFTISSNKIRHERTHTGDKHFVCHFCNTAFASSNGLKYHLTVHTGETNYHCKTCGKSFSRLKYLKEHHFTHMGEKPFVCKTCGASYGNSGSLFAHEKKCKTQFETCMEGGNKYAMKEGQYHIDQGNDDISYYKANMQMQEQVRLSYNQNVQQVTCVGPHQNVCSTENSNQASHHTSLNPESNTVAAWQYFKWSNDL